jgi:thiol-disulfide isomerase/thioredoxin
VKPIHSTCIILFLIFLPLTWLTPGYSSAQKQASKTVKDFYPGLASGVLNSAVPANLPKGTLLTAGDLTIKESEITKVISQSEPAVRKQLTQNAFFLLENMATQKLLLEEAKKAGFAKGGESKAISDLISARIKVSAVTEEEIKNFHNQNKMIANAPLEQLRETIKDYLTQQRRQEAVQQFILTLGQRTPIQINDDWVKKQSTLALDNPVDRARRSGKPTMVEFGASGCVPCDMMTPILADLRKRFPQKLNVLFVHVGQEKMLGVRFGIQGIPVQVFFDKNGQEVFRHTGFFPQEEVEKKLAQMGITN